MRHWITIVFMGLSIGLIAPEKSWSNVDIICAGFKSGQIDNDIRHVGKTGGKETGRIIFGHQSAADWKAEYLDVSIAFQLDGRGCATFEATNRPNFEVAIDPKSFKVIVVREYNSEILMLSNDIWRAGFLAKSDLEQARDATELYRKQLGDNVTEAAFRSRVTINKINYDINYIVQIRKDRYFRIVGLSYTRYSSNVNNDRFKLTNLEMINGFSGEDILRFDRPKTIEDLHEAYNAFEAIRDPLKRPAYSVKVGAWVPLCHPDHPFYRFACPTYVCNSPNNEVRTKCKSVSQGFPSEFLALGTSRVQHNARKWVDDIFGREDFTRDRPRYDESQEVWRDSCHPDSAFYFWSCGYARQIITNRLGLKCTELEKRRKDAEANQANAPFTFHEFSELLGVWVLSQVAPSMNPPKIRGVCATVQRVLPNESK